MDHQGRHKSTAGSRKDPHRFRARIYQGRGCKLQGSLRLRFLQRSEGKRSCPHGRQGLRDEGRRCRIIPFQRIISR